VLGWAQGLPPLHWWHRLECALLAYELKAGLRVPEFDLTLADVELSERAGKVIVLGARESRHHHGFYATKPWGSSEGGSPDSWGTL
jgi:hypothetical protein